jgi:VCBS repeat-containing protein
VEITVDPVNDAPVANDHAEDAEEAGGVDNGTPGYDPVCNVLDSAFDPDAGDSLSVTDVNGDAANVGADVAGAYGTLTLNADGSFTYVVNNSNPDVEALFCECDYLIDSFTYTVTDLDGETSSATLVVVILGQNDAPVASDGSASVAADETLTIDLRTLASDPETDADSLVYQVGTPSHGTLTPTATNGVYAYQPASEYVGPDSFTFSVSDGSGREGKGLISNEATFAITVTGGTFPTIVGVQFGPLVIDYPNQRSRIDRIVVRFTEDLSVHPASAFTLIRNGTQVVPVTVTWSADFSQATLTFSGPGVVGGSLADGRYQLLIDGEQLAGTGGQPIDADGDHQPGGVFSADFHRLFGDADGDGDTDFSDLAQFRLVLGGPSVSPFIAYNPVFDSDGDGDVDFTDLAQFRLRLGTVLP